MMKHVPIPGLLFDSPDWKWAPYDVCKVNGISPNVLAHNANLATFCVIAKRSKGGDFAFSKGSLAYLLKKGKNGEQAIVVAADVKHKRRFKPVKQWTAEELRDRLKDVEPLVGKFGGAYWWLSVTDDVPDDDDGTW